MKVVYRISLDDKPLGKVFTLPIGKRDKVLCFLKRKTDLQGSLYYLKTGTGTGTGAGQQFIILGTGHEYVEDRRNKLARFKQSIRYATKTDYDNWIRKYVSREGQFDIVDYDYNFEAQSVVVVTQNCFIPKYFGADTIDVIVAEEVVVEYDEDIGHGLLYLNSEVIGFHGALVTPKIYTNTEL